MSNPKYWFPAKRYGIGWGAPYTWQGWVVLAAHLAIILTSCAALANGGHIIPFLLTVFLATAALVAICWLKGEPISWRWGDRRRR